MSGPMCFSPCGNYLAHFSVSGRLRVWESETNILRNEFTPSSHLFTPCSCFAWVAVSSSPAKSKKKRRKHDGMGTPLLVLGTEGGQIFFFSIAENDVVATLKAHDKCVTAVAVAPGTDLYSCAKNIILQWDISTKSVKSKWKVDKNICYMAVSEGNRILLTAIMSTIICWDIENRTELRRFEGHKSNIVRLSVGISPSNEIYAFSVAREDRLINVWNISNTSKESAVAVLTIPDIPSIMSSSIDSNGKVTLAVATLKGSLHLYCHQLNGHCKKPIKPTTTVLVSSDAPSKSNKSELIPVLATMVLGDKVKFIYGSPTFINFETIDVNSTDSELFLVRKDPRNLVKKHEELAKKVKSTETSGNIEYLESSSVNHVSLKRDRNTFEDENKVTLQSMLEKMNISLKHDHSSDTLAHLLIQGLNSQDKNILRSVLLTQNENTIRSTVERLPPQAVSPLLKILTTLVQGRSYTSQIGAMWLRSVLRIHTSQLIADNSCSATIEPLLGLIEARLNCLGSLSKLKGRLDLILDQATTTTKEPVIEIQPLLAYQDSDSPPTCILEDDEESEGEHDVDEDYDNWTELNEEESLDNEAEDDFDNESDGGIRDDSADDRGNNVEDEDMSSSS